MGITLSSWYANGSKPNKTLAQLQTIARARYDKFLAYCLTQTGMPSNMPAGAYRIQAPDQGFYLNPNNGGTVSEGIGYGMIVSAWYSNPNLPAGIYDSTAKAHFDGLWAYAKYYRNSKGLMNWDISNTGQICDYNGATDADLDIAMALVIMDRIHGSADTAHPNYATDATAYITAIRDYEFVPVSGHGTYGNVMTNGDGWGFDTDHYMPDYFRAAYMREFAAHTGDNRWLDIVTKNYPMAVDYWNTNYTGGTVPDATVRALTSAPSGYNYQTGYNSIRISYGIALDYLWNGSGAGTNARAFMQKMAGKSLTKYTTGNQVKAIPWDLNHNGDAGYFNSATAQMVGVAALVDSNYAQFAAELMDAMAADTQDSYFGNGLAAYGSMIMAGIAQPGATGTATPPPPTQTVTEYVSHWTSAADSASDFSTKQNTGSSTVTLPSANTGYTGNSLRIVANATANEEASYRKDLSGAPVRIINFRHIVRSGGTLNPGDYTIAHFWSPTFAANVAEIRLRPAGGGYQFVIVEPDNSYHTVAGVTSFTPNQWHSIKFQITDTQLALYIDGSASAEVVCAGSYGGTLDGHNVDTVQVGPMAFGKFYGNNFVVTMDYDDFDAGAIETHQVPITGGVTQRQVSGKASILSSRKAKTQTGVAKIYVPAVTSTGRNQTGKGRIVNTIVVQERTNYFPNPSFNSQVPGSVFGSAQVTVSPGGLDGPSGTELRINAPSGPVDSGTIVQLGQFNGGDKITFSAFAQMRNGAGNFTITIRGAVSDTTIAWTSADTGYVQKYKTVTVNGTGNVEMVIGLGSYGNQSAGQVGIDHILVEKGTALADWFDGNSPNARWLGTANNSASALAPVVATPKKGHPFGLLLSLTSTSSGALGTQPQTGRAAIINSASKPRTIAGVASIRNKVNRDTTGKARVGKNVTVAQPAKAAITYRGVRTIIGRAKIAGGGGKPIYGRGRIAGKPIFGDKRFEYKVYDNAGNYVGNITRDVLDDFEFTQQINSAGSEVTIKLGRPADDYGENTTIKFGNEIRVYVYDQEAPSGQLIFRGELNNYKPVFSGDGEHVVVTLLGYGHTLSRYVIETGDSGGTTKAYNSMDPGNILKAIIDDYNAKGGRITYSGTSIGLTGTSVSYTFNTNTTQEGLDKVLELAPEGWYYYIDQATNILYFKQRVETPDHSFLLDRHIQTLEIEKRIEDITNVVFFTGGDNSASPGSNIFKKYTRPTSISLYGLRATRKNDGRVKTTATADIIANTTLDRHSGPELRTSMVLLDNAVDNKYGYNIESVQLGQMVRLNGTGVSGTGGSSLWDVMQWDVDYWDYSASNLATLVLQVTQKSYSGNKLSLSLSTVPPDVNKRIEDINRELEALQIANNPVAPS